MFVNLPTFCILLEYLEFPTLAYGYSAIEPQTDFKERVVKFQGGAERKARVKEIQCGRSSTDVNCFQMQQLAISKQADSDRRLRNKHKVITKNSLK